MASFLPAECRREPWLRDGGRTGLALDYVAVRAGISRRMIQDRENGRNDLTTQRLPALLLAGDLSPGGEADEAHALSLDASSEVRPTTVVVGSRAARRLADRACPDD